MNSSAWPRLLVVVVVSVLLAGSAGAWAQSDEPSEPVVQPLIAGQGPAAALSDSGTVLLPPLEELRKEHRSAKLAVAMTMVVPGWGQLYADSPFWSVVSFGAQMFYLGNIVMENRRAARQEVRRDALAKDSAEYEIRDLLVTEHRERARDFVWWGAAGYLIIALDAYVSVELFGFESTDPPTPDLDRDWNAPGPSGDGVALGLTFDF